MKAQRRYEIDAVLGRGGFGTVYSATLRGEQGFSKHVALKLLNEHLQGSKAHTSRLRDEARLLGLVHHRAILHVDGLVTFGNRWAIVTEYVPGANLAQILKRGPIPLGVALEIAAEVAGALHVAYSGTQPDGTQLRLVHRDIKPSNIQITRVGEVKLLDFGIAQAEFVDRETKTTELILGSPSYMSPEQLDMRYGPEGDVYGLGVVLCEAMTGRRFGKTSATRERHEPHMEHALNNAMAAVGSQFELVEPLLRSMLSYDSGVRPTAQQVEAECLRIRRSLPAPWLRDWAEATLGDVSTGDDGGDRLVGRVLVEGKALDEAAPIAPRPEKGDDDTTTTLATIRKGQKRAEAAQRASSQAPPTVSGSWGIPAVAFALAFAVTIGSATWVWAQRQPVEDEPRLASITAPQPEVMDSATAGDGSERSGDGLAIADDVGAEPITPPPGTDAAPEPAPAPPPPKPRPAPRSAALVTAGQFSTWLGDHPTWTRDQALLDGTGDDGYLRGWQGADPPAGTSGAVTSVSWWAAREFCRSRGGLASLGAAPQTWSETSGVFQEWRIDGERPAWRRFDGATSTSVRASDANSFTGFRCAR